MRVLSGIQSSGVLHIGNFFGMMEPMLRRQDSDELFVMIADLHSLTTIRDGEKLRSISRDVALDWLALGLDPKKTVFWRQSAVPEVAELAWYLAAVCPMGLLERAHAFKDKTARGLMPNAALFSYPVLMAADILAYQSEKVPVGKDQKQHIEIARDIAEKFHLAFGNGVFTLPEPEISEEVGVILGVDGQKMSKSYGNTIDIFADPATLKKQVGHIVTDSKGVAEPKDPESCTVFGLLKLFLSDADREALAERYRTGGIGYGEAKQMLVAAIDAKFSVARSRREQLAADPEGLEKILIEGATRARAALTPTLQKVRKAVGVA